MYFMETRLTEFSFIDSWQKRKEERTSKKEIRMAAPMGMNTVIAKYITTI